MLNSWFRDLGPVVLPVWQGRQRYMHTFDLSGPQMERGFEDYGPTVEALCATAGYSSGRAHMTVDEKIVLAGMSQRRPGAHVDGCFMATSWAHPTPGWNHYCNNVPIARMPVIVISDVPGCIAYPGQFGATPKNDGDLEHIRGELGSGKLLPAGRGYLLSPDCIHESLVFREDTKRLFLRIALPPDHERLSRLYT